MVIDTQEIPFQRPPLNVEIVQLVEFGYNEYFEEITPVTLTIPCNNEQGRVEKCHRKKYATMATTRVSSRPGLPWTISSLALKSSMSQETTHYLFHGDFKDGEGICYPTMKDTAGQPLIFHGQGL